MTIKTNKYETELNSFEHTYNFAMETDITGLKASISSMAGSSIIAVGSGGSYTAASLICNFHEKYTGRVSRAATPLEIICNPTLATTSPIFLITAEGKNPDISQAFSRIKHNSSRQIHGMTNKESSPFTNLIKEHDDVILHTFPLEGKDGYLATNSLIYDCILIARAYSELSEPTSSRLPSRINGLKIDNKPIHEWIEEITEFLQLTIQRKNLIITYSPLLEPIAIDIESKLSESALLFNQLSDIRTFAHGRHLWLSERPEDCSILSIVEPTISKLWDNMDSLIPQNVPRQVMQLNSAEPKDLISGLIAEMYMLGSIAKIKEKDPGKPSVQSFSKKLYYANLNELVKENTIKEKKHNNKELVLGSRWPYDVKHGHILRASNSYKSNFKNKLFEAIVFDYDGTLCTSQNKDAPPSNEIAEKLCMLLENDIIIGIASGRGGSIHESLRQCIPKKYWKNVQLGLYNGGKILSLKDELIKDSETNEFLSHATRVIRNLKEIGAPIKKIRITHPYQISVRFEEGIDSEYMWFVIADSMRQAGIELTRLVRSQHSVDILSPKANKSHLIADLIKIFTIEPYNILTVGDQGAWPGNDSDLLEHKYSLSVDLPSRRLDRGWNYAPQHKKFVDATLWYLNKIEIIKKSHFQLNNL